MFENRHVLVVGCGRFGASMASSLSNEGYDVTIIDLQEEAFHRLSDTYQGFTIVGDATDFDTLKNCGIEKCSLVLIASNNDNVNCMIAQMANLIFHIDRVYLRLCDPSKEELLLGTSIKAIYPARLSVKEFEVISDIHLKKKAFV